jgi:hypothetical protein
VGQSRREKLIGCYNSQLNGPINKDQDGKCLTNDLTNRIRSILYPKYTTSSELAARALLVGSSDIKDYRQYHR